MKFQKNYVMSAMLLIFSAAPVLAVGTTAPTTTGTPVVTATTTTATPGSMTVADLDVSMQMVNEHVGSQAEASHTIELPEQYRHRYENRMGEHMDGTSEHRGEDMEDRDDTHEDLTDSREETRDDHAETRDDAREDLTDSREEIRDDQAETREEVRDDMGH